MCKKKRKKEKSLLEEERPHLPVYSLSFCHSWVGLVPKPGADNFHAGFSNGWQELSRLSQHCCIWGNVDLGAGADNKTQVLHLGHVRFNC